MTKTLLIIDRLLGLGGGKVEDDGVAISKFLNKIAIDFHFPFTVDVIICFDTGLILKVKIIYFILCVNWEIVMEGACIKCITGIFTDIAFLCASDLVYQLVQSLRYCHLRAFVLVAGWVILFWCTSDIVDTLEES